MKKPEKLKKILINFQRFSNLFPKTSLFKVYRGKTWNIGGEYGMSVDNMEYREKTWNNGKRTSRRKIKNHEKLKITKKKIENHEEKLKIIIKIENNEEKLKITKKN